ncbi:hypothetical protein [Oligoflexus tunisiensis]|uniref:hypothetical protein n=1 Tax=Oligoflexus tunisiensis TaxID=708132 RepID=UPI00114C8A5E|nr:hypothetical protein [Oligoflexus tunisiensis]
MYRLIGLISLAFPLLISQLTFGQASSTKPYPIDLHDHNRAIAFGSALMVTEGGSDQRDWKQVDVMFSCGSGSKPSDPSVPGKPGSGSSDFKDGCTAGVHYVTRYDFVECPDGRAYIMRSGEGVFVISATEGSFFAWAESVACSGSSKPSPVPMPIPSPTDPGAAGLTDENRPLDFDHITRTLR